MQKIEKLNYIIKTLFLTQEVHKTLSKKKIVHKT